jgi:hypothetical protein
MHDETGTQRQSIVATTTSPKEERTMRSKSSRWLSGVGALVLVGGLVLANFGDGVTSAQAHNRYYDHKNPFKQILAKLDEVLAKLNGGSAPASGSGNGGEVGNYITRWDANYPSASRFTIVFPGAVMDKNTGLVWDQSPMVAPTGPTSWISAREYCLNRTVGGTRGWRLPSVGELTSLIDPSLPPPYVPGTVFTGIQSAAYWSATVNAASTSNAFSVSFQDSLVGTSSKNGSSLNHVWCVRSPMQESLY